MDDSRTAGFLFQRRNPRGVAVHWSPNKPPERKAGMKGARSTVSADSSMPEDYTAGRTRSCDGIRLTQSAPLGSSTFL